MANDELNATVSNLNRVARSFSESLDRLAKEQGKAAARVREITELGNNAAGSFARTADAASRLGYMLDRLTGKIAALQIEMAAPAKGGGVSRPAGEGGNASLPAGVKETGEAADQAAKKADGLFGSIQSIIKTGSEMVSYGKKVQGVVTTASKLSGVLGFTGVAAQLASLATPVAVVTTALHFGCIAVENYQKKQQQLLEKHLSGVDGAARLAGQYEALSKKLGAAQKGSLEYRETQVELEKVAAQLGDRYSEAVTLWDENGKARSLNIDKVKEQIEAEKNFKKATEELHRITALDKTLGINTDGLDKQKKAIDKAKEDLKILSRDANAYRKLADEAREKNDPVSQLHLEDKFARHNTQIGIRNDLINKIQSPALQALQKTKEGKVKLTSDAEVKHLEDICKKLHIKEFQYHGKSIKLEEWAAQQKKNIREKKPAPTQVDEKLLAQRRQATEILADRIYELTHTETEVRLREIDRQEKAYRRLGVNRITVEGKTFTVAQWAAKEREKIAEAEEAKRAALTQQIQGEIDNINGVSQEKRLAQIDEQAKAWLEEGAKEATVAAWVAAQKKKLLDEQTEQIKSITERLNREILDLGQKSLQDELDLLETEKQAEIADVNQRITDENERKRLLALIDKKYALLAEQKTRESAEKRAQFELEQLDYQHQHGLISDQEYFDKKLELAEQNLARVEKQYGKESAEYIQAQNRMVEVEYERIAATNQLEGELTAEKAAQVKKSLEDELAKLEASKEGNSARALAIRQALKKLSDEEKRIQAEALQSEKDMLERQHRDGLISEEEYHRQKVQLARKNAAEILKAKGQGGESTPEYQAAIDELSQAEYDAIQSQMNLQGQLTQATIMEARTRLLIQKSEITATDAEAQAKIQAIDRALNELDQKEKTLEAQRNESIRATFSSTLKDLIKGTKSFQDVLDGLLENMLDQFIDMIVNKLLTDQVLNNIINWVFGLFSGGANTVTPTFSSLHINAAAGGMLLGSFSGGMPAILHEKEMVLPKSISEHILNSMGQAQAAGGGAPTHITINAMDAQDVARVLTRNRDVVTGIVAADFGRNGILRQAGR